MCVLSLLVHFVLAVPWYVEVVVGQAAVRIRLGEDRRTAHVSVQLYLVHKTNAFTRCSATNKTSHDRVSTAWV